MSPFPGPWLVVGGWAVDLFIGQPTREHDDVDIGLARHDQGAARRLLPGWLYEKVVPRGTELAREPWSDEEWLELPVHEIHAHSPAGGHVEFLLLERRGDEWVYRRDPRVTLAWDLLSFESRLGVAVLAPEVVLLFKATGRRARDQADFDALLPRLADRQRAWLGRPSGSRTPAIGGGVTSDDESVRLAWRRACRGRCRSASIPAWQQPTTTHCFRWSRSRRPQRRPGRSPSRRPTGAGFTVRPVTAALRAALCELTTTRALLKRRDRVCPRVTRHNQPRQPSCARYTGPAAASQPRRPVIILCA